MGDRNSTRGLPDVLDEYPVHPNNTLDGVLGFQLLDIGETSARGEASFADRVCQRFGVVHGGTYAAFAEMIASEATVHHVWDDGFGAMGSSNSTSFLRPLSSGTIYAEAEAQHRGRTSWVWDVDFRDDQGRLCAVSRVTIAVRPRES